METDESRPSEAVVNGEAGEGKQDKMFSLKKWNAVAMWSWDVECDTCAICRVQVRAIVTNQNTVFRWMDQ